MFLLSGCGGDDEQPSVEPIDKPSTEIEQGESDVDVSAETDETEKVLIEASVIPDDILTWHKVSDYAGDLDNDGEDEELILATTAECDARGNFSWNDGQNWALYVFDGNDEYLLFKEYINTGYPYFEVSDYYMEDGAKTQINVVISSGASFSLRSYEFSEPAGAYVEEVIYTTKNITDGGINTRFSSFPEYQKEVR